MNVLAQGRPFKLQVVISPIFVILWNTGATIDALLKQQRADPGRPVRLLCGGGGIRTPGRLSPTSVFKTDAFNRSATPPDGLLFSGGKDRFFSVLWQAFLGKEFYR